jgi:hypothetical protein
LAKMTLCALKMTLVAHDGEDLGLQRKRDT